MFLPSLFGLLVLGLPLVSGLSTWCGKHYEKGSSVIKPGGKFKEPSKSSSTLLNFRCWPRVQPYLAGETSGQIIVDISLTSLNIPGTQEFSGGTGSFDVSITASVDGQDIPLASASVSQNATGTLLSFNPSVLTTSLDPTTINCAASLGGAEYRTTGTISYLPVPSSGSVTKQDFLTGALLVPESTDQLAGPYKPIIPFGFYTAFDDYLVNDPASIIQAAKESGRNLIHIIPPFLHGEAAFQKVLDTIQDQGLYLMYDLRDDYRHLSSIKAQVNAIKNYANLLLYYTADEPDGWSYPKNSTLDAGNTITSIDPYHPVSLVLNCHDYYFEDYSQGASIIMHDPYPVGINPHTSAAFGTPCNATFGDCGCDGCDGDFGDLTARADLFAHRLRVDGRSRGVSLWSVPQAFGNEPGEKPYWPLYWPRTPTHAEFLLQMIITLNHGSKGIVPWTEDQHMSSSLKSAASALGQALPTIESIILADHVVFRAISKSAGKGVDIGSWTSGGKTLVLGGNMGSKSVTKSFNLGTGMGNEMTKLFEEDQGADASLDGSGEVSVQFQKHGSIALLFS